MGETLHTVSSTSNPAKSYRIIRGADGVVYCECVGWKMSKDCKHLREFLGSCTKSAPSPATPKGLSSRAVKKPVAGRDPALTIAVNQAVKELTGRV